MDDLLTVSEMKQRFPSEWVLIDDPVTNASMEVIQGRVAFHGKDRDEIYREANRQGLKKFATLFTGQIRKDAALVL